MFISAKEAKERLSSRRNIFAAEPIDRSSDDRLEIPETVDIESVPDSNDVSDDLNEETDRLLDMEKLNSLINLSPRTQNKQPYRGKTEAQVAIGKTALMIGQGTAGKIFGLSNSQSEAYAHALTSTADITDHTPPNPSRKQQLDEFREVLAAKAASRLGETLEMLSEQKLSQVKRATNLSKIAKDMAVIVEKVSPKESADQGGVHFHIYKPEIEVEQSYQVVTVGSKV